MISRLISASLLFLACLLSLANSAERTLSWATNPGCVLGPDSCKKYKNEDPFMNFMQFVVSDDSGNATGMSSYRMFWSTIGAPTFLITEAPAGATNDSTIEWVVFLEDDKIQMPCLLLWKGRYAGITLHKLIEFNDEKDSGKLEDAANVTIHQLRDMMWYNSSITYPDDNTLLATFTGTLGSDRGKSNITIEMRAHKSHMRNPDPPKLQVQPSSMSMRIILNNLTTHYKNARFAFDIIFASNDVSKTVANYTEEKSISDEFSPGIFTVEKVGGADTYLQWRPVVYTAAVPGVSDSTRTRTGPLSNITMKYLNQTDYDVPYSLLLGLENLNASTSTLIHFNVSFGQTDDKFYSAANFQEWSLEIGLGQPPVDQVSSKIKLIIAIGFGIPAVLILIGGAYVAYVKMKRRRHNNGLLVVDASPNYESLG